MPALSLPTDSLFANSSVHLLSPFFFFLPLSPSQWILPGAYLLCSMQAHPERCSRAAVWICLQRAPFAENSTCLGIWELFQPLIVPGALFLNPSQAVKCRHESWTLCCLPGTQGKSPCCTIHFPALYSQASQAQPHARVSRSGIWLP